MPDAIFTVHLDDMQGFIVKQRHPKTLALTERMLNLIFYEHQQKKQHGMRLIELENMRIASYNDKAHPTWFVCFTLSEEEDLEEIKHELEGMSRLVLTLIDETENDVDLEDIFTDRLTLPMPNEEQICATIFETPSTAILLEKLETDALDQSARLMIWLKNQIQSEKVSLRETIRPLMTSGVVHVEMIGKTTEMVFLVKDVFCYRAPPVKAIAAAGERYPLIMNEYLTQVKGFFSPAPPEKGYNPTIETDNPNSPIMEDRNKIARFILKYKYYEIIKYLRECPASLEEIAEAIPFPEQMIKKALSEMAAERIVTFLEGENLWALVTDPRIDVFLPEFALTKLIKKYSENAINKEIALRYLDCLLDQWREAQ